MTSYQDCFFWCGVVEGGEGKSRHRSFLCLSFSTVSLWPSITLQNKPLCLLQAVGTQVMDFHAVSGASQTTDLHMVSGGSRDRGHRLGPQELLRGKFHSEVT